jgi:hypothetical protein
MEWPGCGGFFIGIAQFLSSGSPPNRRRTRHRHPGGKQSANFRISQRSTGPSGRPLMGGADNPANRDRMDGAPDPSAPARPQSGSPDRHEPCSGPLGRNRRFKPRWRNVLITRIPYPVSVQVSTRAQLRNGAVRSLAASATSLKPVRYNPGNGPPPRRPPGSL